MPGISSQHVRDRRFRLLYPLSSRSQPSKQLEARREVVKYGKDEKRKKRKYVWEARNRRRLIRGQNTCILPKKRKLLRGCTCSRRVPPEGYQACAVYRHWCCSVRSDMKTLRSHERCAAAAPKRDRVSTNVSLHSCGTPAVEGTAHQWDPHCIRCRKTLDRHANRRCRSGCVSSTKSQQVSAATGSCGWPALWPVLYNVLAFQSTRKIKIHVWIVGEYCRHKSVGDRRTYSGSSVVESFPRSENNIQYTGCVSYRRPQSVFMK